jgi:hypothetical protein
MMGAGLWPGACTMIAGPTGAGKTIMGLHLIRAGAEHGERGVIAALQENPTQLDRMLGGKTAWANYIALRLIWSPPGRRQERRHALSGEGVR